MMKKLAALVLAAILAAGICCAASADDIRTSGLYTYSIKGNGTVTITKYRWASSQGDIYIPSMIDGYTVTGIGDEAFAYSKKEPYPLKHVEGAVIVQLPGTITTIGEKAFFCAPVTTINIPASVKYIGAGAFGMCPITQFSMTEKNDNFAVIDGALYNKSTKTLIAYPIARAEKPAIPEGIAAIGDYAVSGYVTGDGGNFDFISLPDTVKSIGNYAFYQSRFVIYKDHFLPAGLKSIGDYAFCDSALFFKKQNYPRFNDPAFVKLIRGFETDLIEARAVFPAGLEYLGVNCFQNAYILITGGNRTDTLIFDIDCPELTIGSGAFSTIKQYGMQRAVNIYVRSAKAIGKNAFAINNVDNGVVYGYSFNGHVMVNLEKAVQVDDYAFSTPLLSVKGSWPGAIASIPEGAFSGNDEMQSLTIESGVISIGKQAFLNAKKLESVDLPDTLERIEAEAFKGCEKLLEISLPGSIRSIGDGAFERKVVALTVEAGSYAELWASENGYSYRYADNYEDDLDWLNN